MFSLNSVDNKLALEFIRIIHQLRRTASNNIGVYQVAINEKGIIDATEWHLRDAVVGGQIRELTKAFAELDVLNPAELNAAYVSEQYKYTDGEDPLDKRIEAFLNMLMHQFLFATRNVVPRNSNNEANFTNQCEIEAMATIFNQLRFHFINES